jgi:hypothetical protein
MGAGSLLTPLGILLFFSKTDQRIQKRIKQTEVRSQKKIDKKRISLSALCGSFFIRFNPP